MNQQEIFQNSQIDVSVLPTATDLEWKPLQPSYRKFLLLSTGLWCAVFLAAITIAIPFVNLPVWIGLSAYALVIVFTMVQVLFILKGFPFKGYALRMHDVLYKSGWLYKRQIGVPLNRIQHVDIRQGLFERAFGLSRLNVYTAGGQSSDITIPGLTDSEAQQLKEYILKESTAQELTAPESTIQNEEE